jgi:hypothetical protein
MSRHRALWPMLEFGMGFSLSASEQALVRHIFQPIEEALIWTNDYWSFDREFDESQVHGHRLYNVVDVLVRTKSLSIKDAKLEVRGMILQCEQLYVKLKTQFYRDHENIPTNLKKWIEVAACTVSGTHYWASTCNRNHAWRENSFHIVTRREVAEGDSAEANTPDLDSSSSSVCSRSTTDGNSNSLPRVDSDVSSELGHAFGDTLDTKLSALAKDAVPRDCGIPVDLSNKNSTFPASIEGSAEQPQDLHPNQTESLFSSKMAPSSFTQINKSNRVRNGDIVMCPR